MKKIMFNDQYGLTDAVIKGSKTMTRRVIGVPEYWRGQWVWGAGPYGQTLQLYDADEGKMMDEDTGDFAQICPKYHKGEEIAIAQRYSQLFTEADLSKRKGGLGDLITGRAFDNKMFVRAEVMPHRIRITDIKVEQLQDISEDDCLREGIIRKWIPAGALYYYYVPGVKVKSKYDIYPTAREAFAVLIDKVSGKGTWVANPWVFVYSFELVV